LPKVHRTFYTKWFVWFFDLILKLKIKKNQFWDVALLAIYPQYELARFDDKKRRNNFKNKIFLVFG
jgi:hypothetical protein